MLMNVPALYSSQFSRANNYDNYSDNYRLSPWEWYDSFSAENPPRETLRTPTEDGVEVAKSIWYAKVLTRSSHS